MKRPNRNEWRNWSKNNPPEEHFDAMRAKLHELFEKGSLANTKAECSYIEAREQFRHQVLESDDYYNGHIQVRVHGSHIKGKI